MTDLEIVKVCALAMELEPIRETREPFHRPGKVWIGDAGFESFVRGGYIYDPLHDDAQAMALVKRFNLLLEPDCQLQQGWWAIPGAPHRPAYKKFERGAGCFSRESLNRAICLCVAQLPPRSKG